MRALLLVALCLLLALLAQGLPSPNTPTRDAPPSKDPFYTPPTNYENTAPGTILRHRSTPYIDSKQPNAHAHSILYRTTDNFGHATTTVTTVLIPPAADFSKLLSYQVAEDSASIDCAPSYKTIRTPPNNSNLLDRLYTGSDRLFITTALQRGWVVVVPDFEGPHAAFLANFQAGYAVLDGLRAVLASTRFTGVDPTAAITLWGYSGGSLATGFAAELQPGYAPEVKILGAALGGVIGNIATVVRSVNRGLLAGLIPSGFYGLANVYPELAALLEEQLVDDEAKREKFRKARRQCLVANLEEFAGEDIVGEYFGDPDFADHPLIREVQRENELGKSTPEMPLLVYKGTLDEVSPVDDTEALAARYCADGATLELREIELHEHLLLAIDGFLEAIPWLVDRMDGVEVAQGCSTSASIVPISDLDAIDTLVDTVEGGLGAAVDDLL
ncbi:hypothetical protein FE257_002512 [Aspergillus nanangensis]|uniref:Secretory lipase-domain-containing protein n=1 Tax=Aspergillus nanangensis TaxID=2582783 RepID=A0AAD4GWR2_ASPNN|nr:hypothetical protein FE257_002512 [Aspergillus nanangensis]